MADRCHVRVGNEPQSHQAAVQFTKEEFVHIEHGLALAILRQAEHRLGHLNDLANLEIARGDDTSGASAKLGISESVLRGAELCFCCFERALGAAQSFLGLII